MYLSLCPKELFCDIRALLGVLGVPVRADLLGVLGGQHGTAHHHLAIQLGGVEGRNGLLHALKGCGHQGGEAHKVDVFFPDSLHYGLHGNIAAQSAFDEIKTAIAQRGGSGASKGRIVLATVKGDVHDIGKNIVKVILENYGFEVIDLGRDVPVETVVDTVREKDVHLVGLSALMTTTLKSMEETIAALHAAKLDCKIMVGGAVLTPEYAEKIGADWYAKDAKRSADIAKEFFGV